MSVLLRTWLGTMLTVAVFCRGAETLPAPASLAASDFVVREWHVDDGLPHEDVMQLLQARDGYLYVACRGSLARFDGTTFLPFSEAEAHEIFYGMSETSDGSIVLTPREGDPLRYRDGRFTREPLPAPYNGRPIGVFFPAPDGALWYAIKGAALRIARGAVRTFGTEDGVSTQSWTRFATDAQGNVWLSSDRLLARYENDRLVMIAVPDTSPEVRVISSRNGGPWLITTDRVFKFDDSKRPIEITGIPPLLGAHYINTACEDRNGHLWLGTRSEGLHVVGLQGHFQIPTANDTIYALLEDRDGTMWVGTNTGGLSAVARKIYSLYNKTSGLASTSSSAVCADNAGDIWLANGDGGVARIRGAHIDHWTLRAGGRLMAAGAVSRHPNGGVWATGGNGAAMFRIADERSDASLVDDIPSGGIHATLFTAKNGDLWLTTSDRRVGRLRERTFSLYGPKEGAPASGVRTFAESPEGDVLVGTNEGTVLKFDGARFVAGPWPVNTPSAINAIQKIGDALWLGTASHGLAICRGPQTTFVGTANGLPDDNVTQLMPDELGNVWCSSGHGVFRLAIGDVERLVQGETRSIWPLRLGKDEGLGTLTGQGIYGPGAAKSRDGRLWFATRQGVLAIDPRAEALAPPSPTVRIEQVLADETPQPLTHPWLIDPSTRKLEVRFSVLCLSAPSRVQTRYRLTGFDTAWIDGKSTRTAAYPRLAPGRYRFEVTAGFDGAAGARQTDAIDIVVAPLWWQTTWFRFAVIVGTTAALTLVIRTWSHRRLQRRIEKLERETDVARVRARIAQDIHDEVGASLTRISLLTQTSAPNSPEAENLERIDETAREVTRSLDEIVWAVNPHHDTLESFVSYLTDFAQKFLGPAGVRCRLVIPPHLPSITLPSETRHDLFLCCREALNNVIKHAGASEVTLRLTIAAATLVIVIADNGRGLAAERATPSAGRISTGHGRRNLAARMQRLGGSCVLESPTTGGTTVTLTLKLPAAAPSLS